jgi:hypothetical protein
LPQVCIQSTQQRLSAYQLGLLAGRQLTQVTLAQKEKQTMRNIFFALLFVFAIDGCATLKADAKADYNAIISCASITAGNEAVKAAAIACVANTVDGNEALCLNNLAPLANWSAAELQCVVNQTTGGLK